MTTRAMRPGESQGKPYFHISTEEFEQKIKTGEVFEFTITVRDGEYRGMSKQIIDEIIKTGKIQFKDCDEIGIRALRREYPNQVIAIYLHVPKEEVARRIRERGGSEEDMANRLADYDEYSKIRELCDYTIENCDLGNCVEAVHKLVQGIT